MITALHLDDYVVVPGGKDLGSGVGRQDLRQTSFARDDGWDIREVLPGVFSVYQAGMLAPVTIGGYGYSYASASEAAPSAGDPVTGAPYWTVVPTLPSAWFIALASACTTAGW